MKLSTCLAVLPLSFSGVSAASYSNPLRDVNGGDPNIVWHDGWYYFMSTNFANLQMTRARTLDGLKNGETKLIWADSEPSRCCNVWAPEMHYIDGAWHVYYSAGPNPLSGQRSHAIRGGSTPWDMYGYAGELQTPGFFSIDGTIVRLQDQNYFVYSGFVNGGFEAGEKQKLYITPLTGATTTGEHKVLSEPAESWELVGEPVNEGPYALYNGNKTFIAFSGSYCGTPSYALGTLEWTGGDPMDSANWVKTGPHFTSANGEFGTGHNSFFTSPDGSETWNVYHSTPNSGGNCGDQRRANAVVVRWNEDGTPDFGVPPGYGQVLPGPSGE
ncbi:hypothetical protein CKM354_000880700 [Cercospora kikuchii]|uniref:Uncharacterized protein n=1 Tax=Cercospora kikuchii TaxID=84275 RepID=A0A9P3CS53_9PEZI|nr:uncharacterized protein CKM354_000880700 [Cercospora kikuchii]GIZ45650.1 hypothetical protein CKM354_000880700 [Cercospora kikuchii]